MVSNFVSNYSIEEASTDSSGETLKNKKTKPK